jgi:cation:H+ antiporter
VHPVLTLVVGLAAAALGGEFFVRGVVGLAHWARIPAGIIGATVAAFATSSPELSVAVSSARAGTPQIAIGDALGSNVVNLGLILGLALLFGPIRAAKGTLRRDFPVAFLAPLMTGLLLLDGELSQRDGALLLAIFAGWLGFTISAARHARDATETVLGEQSSRLSLLLCLVGLGLLIFAGSAIVTGAKFIGEVMGLSTFVIGATVVAIGTSTPELATTIISRMRGHEEIGLGTVLGSNIFNGFFVVSVASLIHPVRIPLNEVLVGIVFGILTILVSLPKKKEVVTRGQGFLLLSLYVIYNLWLVFMGRI